MHKLWFYRDYKGKEPVVEYLNMLSSRRDKDSRIKFNKCNDYIQALSQYGLRLNSNYIKHLEDEIWELRPINDRILFAEIDEKDFVILHHFVKKTQKTPKSEIEKAKKELASFLERRDLHE